MLTLEGEAMGANEGLVKLLWERMKDRWNCYGSEWRTGEEADGWNNEGAGKGAAVGANEEALKKLTKKLKLYRVRNVGGAA